MKKNPAVDRLKCPRCGKLGSWRFEWSSSGKEILYCLNENCSEQIFEEGDWIKKNKEA